jgi:membrane protein insertase Oxa1/YidC/SpoIIIJ
MFFQAKLQPTGVAATPDQARQQQMMKYMMPAMMLFIFYGMPSGLSLYVMASTFAGVAEQVIIRKHIAERSELEARTTVKVSGGGMRGSRPKKPKGPFWFKR